jgi:hypothetical protein
METFSGLRIAYLSGVQAEDALTAKPFNYTITNVQSLEVSTRTVRYHKGTSPLSLVIRVKYYDINRLVFLYIF